MMPGTKTDYCSAKPLTATKLVQQLVIVPQERSNFIENGHTIWEFRKGESDDKAMVSFKSPRLDIDAEDKTYAASSDL
jgi:hypothetical protein